MTLSRGNRTGAQESGTTWQQLTPPDPLPSPRWDLSLAASDAERILVLFGGRDSGGAALGDTWIYSRTRNVWTGNDSPGPSPRFGHAIAEPTDNRGFYLFGGQSADTFFNDLWFFGFESGQWTQIDDGSRRGPSPRYGTSLVATGKGALIVSHGFTDEGRFDDTWRFDLDASTWKNQSPEDESERPLKRCLHEAVWSERSQRMLLYGGCSSGFGPCPQGDLWSFNPVKRRWTEIKLDAAPAARSNPGMVYDHPRNQLLLFGGLTEAGYDKALWSLTGEDSDQTRWIEIPAAGDLPPARASHDAVITGPHLYVFGGTGGVEALNDLWTIDRRSIKST